MSYWPNKSVVAAGGSFLVSHVIKVFEPRWLEYDSHHLDELPHFTIDVRPDMIIHAAGIVAGITVNRAHAGAFFPREHGLSHYWRLPGSF